MSNLHITEEALKQAQEKTQADRIPFEKFAAETKYICRWGEKIQIGDQFLSKPHAHLAPIIYRCGSICPFTGKISPDDHWATEKSPDKCVKILPVPPLNALTVGEKLDQIIDLLENTRSRLITIERKIADQKEKPSGLAKTSNFW